MNHLSENGTIQRINELDLTAVIADNVLPEKTVRFLLSQCPDQNNAHDYPESFIEVGATEAKAWNIPADESFIKQGVVIRRATPPSFFTSPEWKKWVARQLNLPHDNLALQDWKYKTHLNESNGVWLHSDFRKHGKRNILILLYVSDDAPVAAQSGGELLLFTHNHDTDATERQEHHGYQNNRPLTELLGCNVIRTDGVGGEFPYHGKMVDFKLAYRITPKFNRLVLMDYRHSYNVHAVSPKRHYHRSLIEQWFYIDD